MPGWPLPGSPCLIQTHSFARKPPLPMQLLNTLYVTTPETYLRLDNDTLRVRLNKKPGCACPAPPEQAVVCFGHIGLSAADAPAGRRGIALVLLDDNGRFKAGWKVASAATCCCARRSFNAWPTPRLHAGHGPRQRGGQDQKHPPGACSAAPASPSLRMKPKP
jgi:hypothetical protein